MLKSLDHTTKKKQPPQSSKKLFANIGYFTLGISIFVLIFALLIYIDSQFYLRNIYIITKEENVPIQQLQGLKGTYLLFSEEEELRSYLMKANPVLKNINVAKQLPDSILISYEVYSPQVLLNSGNDQYILSQEGIVLGKNITDERKEYAFPIVEYYRQLPAGLYTIGKEVPEKDIKDALYFFKLLKDMGLKVNSIDIASFHMLGLYTDDKEYIFTSEKDIELQKYQLETIIRQFRIEGNDYSKIDLRFDKPIVSY